MIQRFRMLFVITAVFFSVTAFGQTALPANTIITQNFNSIGSSATAALPSAWKMSSAGTGATATYAGGTNVTATSQAASSGLPSAGGRYNWATTADTDRSIGFLTSAGYTSSNAIMAHYRNATGATVNSVTLSFAIERYVVNTSTVSVSLFYSTDGNTWTAQPTGDVNTTDFATGAATGTFSSPATVTKAAGISVTLPDNSDIYFRWVFTNTGTTTAQGLGLDDVSVFAGTATPVLTAKLKDILQVDNGNQNQFNEGDVIRYETVIKNVGSGAANGVQLTIPAPSNTTLVGGSVRTSAVATDDKYGTSFNTPLNGTTILANDFGVPSPTAVISFGTSADAAIYTPGTAGASDVGGSLTVNANGTFSYTPPTGFSGVDRFKYITGNGNLPNNDAVVTITVAADITFSTTNVDPACNGGANGSITFSASGGSGSLTYSIDNGSSFQSSPVFTGLGAGTYQLVVKDVVGYQKTGTATLNNPAAIVVSGTISALTYNTVMATAGFTKTGGTGTITWSATGLPTGLTINASSGDVSGTPAQTGSFTATITATDANGCTGTRNVSFTVAPNLSNDAYTSVVGNTQLVADAHSTPATPYTVSAVNILANDASDAALSVTAVTDAATTAGGRITIDATGRFTYSPAAGSTVADSYIYTATSNGVTATATISFTVSNMVWYVNNTYAGANGAANGTSHRPFATVNAAITPSAVNQLIYVHTGSGNTTGAAVLKSGQILRGAGTALNIGALSIAAGTKPILTGTITLANSVTVDGFDMNTGTTTALTSASATGVNVTIGNITTSGAVNAIALSGTTGAITINGGSLTGGGGAVVNINGGSASFTYAGNMTQTTAAQRLISVQNITGGTVTFSGNLSSTGTSTGLVIQNNTGGTINFSGATKTLNTGASPAVTLATNAGATINFSGGGLTITTSTGAGFNATGGGTVNVTGTGNAIASSGGVALNMVNTTIGTSNLAFRSISSNGGANGIVLNNTGASGGLTVSGDGVNWGSGGTIQNTTGADGATAGNGIYLNNTRNISLNFMRLNDHSNNAISGNAVRGLAINKCRFTGLSGSSNSGTFDESVVNLVDAGGDLSFRNSYFSGGAFNTVRIENITGTSPVISSLLFDTDTLTTMQGSTMDVRSTALLVNLMDGSLTTGTIQNSRFDYWWGNAVHVLSQGTASATVSILNNYCNNTNGALAGAGGIWVAGGTLNYTISGNTILNTNGTAISADRTNFGSLMRGTISGNNIGASGVANSGSGTGIAIFASHHGNQTTTTTISNNVIRQVNGSASGAITALMGDDVGFGDAGGGSFNVSILNNNIQESGTTVNNAQHGILLTIGMVSSGATGGDNGVGCFNIQGNVITNFTSGTANNRIRVNQRFKTTARFPGYLGPNNDNAALSTYLSGRNTASTYSIVNNTTFPGPGFSNTPGGVPCAQ